MKNTKRRRPSHRQMIACQLVLSVLILFTKGGLQELCTIAVETLLSDLPTTEVVESNSSAD